jgi:hypothetical protein
MTRHLQIGLLFFFLNPLLLGCHSHQPASPPENSAKEWPQHMQGLGVSVMRLVPFIYSEKAFEDPANHKQILDDIRSFGGVAHEITPKMGEHFLGTDPIVKYNLQQLKYDVARAEEAFEMGSLDYSRGTMKNVMNHCFNCHSMNGAPSKINWNISQFQSLNLTPLERSDLYVATRQFDASKNLLEGLLKDPDYIQALPLDFEAALRRYLALMVRVKKDPKSSLRELEQLQERKGVPFYVQDHLHAWMESLRKWSHEKPSRKPLLQQARERMSAAHRLQNFAKDHSGDVEYLRATALLHEFLQKEQPPEAEAEAFYLLGQSYEALDEPGFWNIHEVYYESCVRALPKTKQAQNCFRRFEASIYLGYSGSSGIHVPQSERERINDLKALL